MSDPSMSNTLDTPTRPCGKLSPGFNQVMSLKTSPVLHREIHPISGSEQIPCSRVEGEMEIGQRDLPAEIADTTSSLDDGAKPCGMETESPFICGKILSHPTETQWA